MSTPTARALARLRELGYLADVVERRLPRCFITRDLFGCIDVVAVRPGEVLGVQCTSASNLAARLARARGAPGLRDWLAAGARFGVWGWAKRWPLRTKVSASAGTGFVKVFLNTVPMMAYLPFRVRRSSNPKCAASLSAIPRCSDCVPRTKRMMLALVTPVLRSRVR